MDKQRKMIVLLGATPAADPPELLYIPDQGEAAHIVENFHNVGASTNNTKETPTDQVEALPVFEAVEYIEPLQVPQMTTGSDLSAVTPYARLIAWFKSVQRKLKGWIN